MRKKAEHMVNKQQFGVYIGRFQPLHKAHLAVMQEALNHVETLIVVLGSADAPRSVRNPWHEEERERMIRAALTEVGIPDHRMIVTHVRDHYYNENLWLAAVQQAVQIHTRGATDIGLVGHLKDDTSYYLHSFPGWSSLPTGVPQDQSAAHIRQVYFEGDVLSLQDAVPSAIYSQLLEFKETPAYAQLAEEWRDIQADQALWAGTPFPPTFHTTDAVVVRSGHVLTIRRGVNPGKGKLALPGGFLDVRQPLLTSAIRELREETGLGMMFEVRDWTHYLAGKETFDHPERSLRGRTITTAFYFDLGVGALPNVSGHDDATEALWMPISQALATPREWFEDHHAILEAFVLTPSLGRPGLPHLTHMR